MHVLCRPKNGGLIGMSDLLRLLDKKRSAMMQKVTDDDVKRAVKKLSVLGEGFQLIEMEERTMVRQSYPRYGISLATDHLCVCRS
jgi:ESCRT-II complex subunit VPS22